MSADFSSSSVNNNDEDDFNDSPVLQVSQLLENFAQNEPIFDNELLYPSPKQSEITKFSDDNQLMQATIESIISYLTSPDIINYQFAVDFFLSFRTFIDSLPLLELLLCRLTWCLKRSLSPDEAISTNGKLTLVRTFVTLRHWLLNHFQDDFLNDPQMRELLTTTINELPRYSCFIGDSQPTSLQAKVIIELKKSYIVLCHIFWNTQSLSSLSSVDMLHYPLNSYSSMPNSRLSAMALRQIADPSLRRSGILSMVDKPSTSSISLLPLSFQDASATNNTLESIIIHENVDLNRRARTNAAFCASQQELVHPYHKSHRSKASRSRFDSMLFKDGMILHPKASLASLNARTSLCRDGTLENLYSSVVNNVKSTPVRGVRSLCCLSKSNILSAQERANTGFSVGGTLGVFTNSSITKIAPVTPLKRLNGRIPVTGPQLKDMAIDRLVSSSSSGSGSMPKSGHTSLKKTSSQHQRRATRLLRHLFPTNEGLLGTDREKDSPNTTVNGARRPLAKLDTNIFDGTAHRKSASMASVDISGKMDILSARVVEDYNTISRNKARIEKDKSIKNDDNDDDDKVSILQGSPKKHKSHDRDSSVSSNELLSHFNEKFDNDPTNAEDSEFMADSDTSVLLRERTSRGYDSRNMANIEETNEASTVVTHSSGVEQILDESEQQMSSNSLPEDGADSFRTPSVTMNWSNSLDISHTSNDNIVDLSMEPTGNAENIEKESISSAATSHAPIRGSMQKTLNLRGSSGTSVSSIRKIELKNIRPVSSESDVGSVNSTVQQRESVEPTRRGPYSFMSLRKPNNYVNKLKTYSLPATAHRDESLEFVDSVSSRAARRTIISIQEVQSEQGQDQPEREVEMKEEGEEEGEDIEEHSTKDISAIDIGAEVGQTLPTEEIVPLGCSSMIESSSVSAGSEKKKASATDLDSHFSVKEITRNSSGSNKSYMTYDSSLSSDAYLDEINKSSHIMLRKKNAFSDLRQGLSGSAVDHKNLSNMTGIPTSVLDAYSVSPSVSSDSLSASYHSASRSIDTKGGLTNVPLAGGNSTLQSGSQNDSQMTELQSNSSSNNSKTTTQSRSCLLSYPGISESAIAELAAIPDRKINCNPIAYARSKLRGEAISTHSSNRGTMNPQNSEDDNDSRLERKVRDLFIVGNPNDQSSENTYPMDHVSASSLKENSENAPANRKLWKSLGNCTDFSVAQNSPYAISYTSAKLLSGVHKVNVEDAMNGGRHIPFVLCYSSEVLFNQMTLIERDLLLAVDWKELVNMKWDEPLVPYNSWLRLLLDSSNKTQLQMVTLRFNLVTNWIISEILLCKDMNVRIMAITRFIHLAITCKRHQNYATMFQIMLALTAPIIKKLKSTWNRVDAGDLLIFKELKDTSSPHDNFRAIRVCMDTAIPSKGIIPFIALDLSDLNVNSERPNIVECPAEPESNSDNSESNDQSKAEEEEEEEEEPYELINFDKFRIRCTILKRILRLIDWSRLYKLKRNDEVLSKCLYISSLSQEEMDYCMDHLEEA